jgi:hypothetical protein
MRKKTIGGIRTKRVKKGTSSSDQGQGRGPRGGIRVSKRHFVFRKSEVLRLLGWHKFREKGVVP